MTRLLVLVCACLWLAGCSSSSTSLSERLVAPGGTSPLLDEERIAATIATVPNRSGHVVTRDGVPIFWRAIDPGQYAMHYRYLGQRTDPAHALDVDFSFKLPTAKPPAPRGTVVLLHGWMMDGDSLLPWSLQLAQAGYRVVTIDLRNHGHSGGGLSGYGTRESDDVIDVLDSLQPRGEIRGPLYLFGISYGAATALFTADKLGSRVTGVVAMESFANAGRGIRDMVPHLLASQPHGWRGRAVAAYARWRYADQNIDAVIAAADTQLKLDLDRVDVAHALADTRSCVLLLHGDADQHIPVAHGRALALASARAHYLELPGENHLSLPLRLDVLGGPIDQWLAQVQQDPSHCPAPQALPASTLAVASPFAPPRS
ncbi:MULTISPECIES: alpha/beta hydrolase family protein [Xanthomonas]|uniref:Alpha/beta hydrolase n=1 Tax=Xanthomonas phaseoli pv. dieffenbachiae TaxID=92828 RepID=A0A1V9HD09_9XANT|nr:alpha/beta fold hydrolase [Xanthomonas phaseoli]MBO9766171.1 alpha/beta fold hydrolase [Xanthomonas phaseoli pv. dieffenbachiae]MBO9775715.1 alpha/beta fold hydrolase [Xanthomonas phaseoli pv. dieffenbachiae]MBO9779583.1 alpha/beta fold hydrolase [Xanthomonas phaseoli pv. dieffenbachiae]MBO9787246.1 alpha/beta fold hydrolase [Xanthomonas phaseoli pv. dieffenbachiae]MBO9797564.1 alpha/beta fold hydrolase [Xanthomonas phaseoli pv. dieffenbachiae]